MSIVDDGTLYSQEQLVLLFEELNEVKEEWERLWQENRKLKERIETKDALIESYDEENRKLKERDASIRAICAVPASRLGPYSKLIMITASQQLPYSAGKHGGDANVMLTSMKRWDMAIGGNGDNTNTLNRNIKPLEATGTIIRTEKDCQDGQLHFAIELNEEHFRDPKLIQPTEERPNNGGNKRCPQCGEFCKKRVDVTYECLKCGIDFDGAMNPRSHGTTPVEPTPPPQVQPEPVQATPIDWSTPISIESIAVETVLSDADITAAFGPKRR